MLSDEKRLKIIDFGLARKLTDNVECREMLGTPEFVGMCQCMCSCLYLYVCCRVLAKVTLCWRASTCVHIVCLQCFDTVGCSTGRASSL